MNEPPARRCGTGRHRLAADGKSRPWPRAWLRQWPRAWRYRNVSPRFLTAAAVALALASAGNAYATVHADVPAHSLARSPAPSGPTGGTAVQAPRPAAGSAAGQQSLPPPLTPGAAQSPPAVTARYDAALVDAPAANATAPSSTPAAVDQAAAPPAAVPPAAVDPPAVPAPAAAPDAAPAAGAAAIGPGLDQRIDAIIQANSAYALGVALIDVSDGAVHEYGAQDKFVAASTAKILAAAAYYNLTERGLASLDEPLGDSTAGEQIGQMVQQSNNDSWALILDAVGQEEIRDYAASIGIDYDRTVNLLTPAEMARTLSLLYTGQLLSAEHTAQLLSYMQDTNYELLIPAAVPPGVGVFHKYGLLYGYLHDASILVQDGRAYVFVVYTRGADLADMDARARIIQQLTRTVTAALF